MKNESEEYRKKCSKLLTGLGKCNDKEILMANFWQVEGVDYLTILERLTKYRAMVENEEFHDWLDSGDDDE